MSALFARAPAFASFLQAVPDSSKLSLTRGADNFYFQPLLIVPPPSVGKTTLAHLMIEVTGLPTIFLEGATMMTTVALTGADSVFRRSRPSAILHDMIQHGIGNSLVVLDQFNKPAYVSHCAWDNPAEALLVLGSANRWKGARALSAGRS